MEDPCLQRKPNQKVAASGISIFLLEELGDARLRCAQLKKYVDEAVKLIEKSGERDHFFEVAAHLIHGIPDTLLRMDKALSAAAMAAAKMDYEEHKDDLRPEKVEELERALEDVRIRRVQRRSKEARSVTGLLMGKALEAFRTVVLPQLQHETKEALEQAVTDAMIEFARMRAGNPTRFSGKLDRFKPVPDMDEAEWVDQVEEAMEMWFSSIKKTLSVKQAAESAVMKIPEAVARLEHLAASIEATGTVNASELSSLIVSLEGQSVKKASATTEIAGVLRELSASLLDTSDPENRPSRVLLAATLRRILGDTVDLKTAGFGPLKIRNREHGSGVAVDDFMAALNQAAENLYACRGTNDAAQTAVDDALTGRIARIGPLTGMPNNVIAVAEKVKKSAYELRFAMGDVANDWEHLARLMKKAIPEAERYDVKYAAEPVADDTKESRFEEGKPADPTKQMDPDDAKKWKQNTEEHKDDFKAASAREEDILYETANLYLFQTPRGLEIRLNGPTHAVVVGKPNDVVSAKRSMDRMERYPDKLRAMYKLSSDKEAASGDPRWIHAKFPGKDTDGKPFKRGDLVLYFPNDRSFMQGEKAKDAYRRFETEVADEDVYNNTFSMYASEEVLSRFEEGKPADPTKQMSPEDAKKWKQQTEEHKDEFKAAAGDPWKVEASAGPSPSGSNWKEIKGFSSHAEMFKGRPVQAWTWESPTVTFLVQEFEGPGIPLYSLGMVADIGGKEYKLQTRRPPQFKKPQDAFKFAADWHKQIDAFENGGGVGLDFTRDWKPKV